MSHLPSHISQHTSEVIKHVHLLYFDTFHEDVALWNRVLHWCGNGDKPAVSRRIVTAIRGFGDEKIRTPVGIEGTGVNIVGIPR